MIYKLFLDDLREIRQVYRLADTREWILVKNYTEFVNCVKKNGLPLYLSLDHDLADEHYHTDGTFKEKTGYDCAKWLCDYCLDNNLNFPDYQVHSMNPIGAENIRGYIKSFKKNR